MEETVYKIIQIVSGQVYVSFSGTNEAEARQKYARMRGAGGYYRVMIDDRTLTIRESDKWCSQGIGLKLKHSTI